MPSGKQAHLANRRCIVKEDTKFVVGGAAAGAILGALAGWLYSRSARDTKAQASPNGIIAPAKPLEKGQVFRLATLVIGVIRQLIDMG